MKALQLNKTFTIIFVPLLVKNPPFNNYYTILTYKYIKNTNVDIKTYNKTQII